MSPTLRVRGVSARNFAGLRDGFFSFDKSGGGPSQAIAVVGKRGAGKTSLLQALLTAKELAAPYGYPLPLRARDPGRTVSVELSVLVGNGAEVVERRVLLEDGGAEPIREVPTEVAVLFSRYEHGTPTFKVDYFPADRFLPPWPGAAARPKPALAERAQRLSIDPTKYTSVWPWFVDAIAKERRARDAATQAAGFAFVDETSFLMKQLQAGLATLDTGLRLAGLGASGEPVFRTEDGSIVPIDGLPTSARHAFLFVLSYQMVQHQRSIILVDEPERGCAPGDAARRFGGLVRLGGASQLIVATNLRGVADAAEAVVEVGS